jgi:eukaryotic-like serine/threonine-protein kinase
MLPIDEQVCEQCDREHARGSEDCPARLIGEILDGRYRLEALLGAGGFGAVFRGTHLHLGRPCAVKVLLPRHARQEGFAARFLREAKSAAAIRHTGIVEIADFGIAATGPFLVMELLEGRSLAHHLHAVGGKLSIREALNLVVSAAEALAFAHRANIVHRDLKPENLFLVPTASGPRLKIVDFGLAKQLEGEPALTVTGEAMGTLHYMSPEQLESFRDVDHRCDLYALGAVLFELLSGHRPAGTGTATEILVRIVRGHIERHPKSRRPEVSSELDAVVARCLAQEPGGRYASAEELVSALAAVPDVAAEETTLTVTEPWDYGDGRLAYPDDAPPPTHRRRRVLAAGFGALTVVSIGLVWWLVRDPQPLEQSIQLQPSEEPPPGMVPLPGGRFLMGSTAEEIEEAYQWCLELTSRAARDLTGAPCDRRLYEREGPVREVEISPFFLHRSEVTNEEFAGWLSGLDQEEVQFGDDGLVTWRNLPVVHLGEEGGGLTAAGGSLAVRSGMERLPMVRVTWYGASEYCRAQGWRLPTEAEWELAARGVARRRFPWGDEPPACERAVLGRTPEGPCAHLPFGSESVATLLGDRTPEGIVGLAGNVSEWVADAFVPSYPPCDGPCRDPFVEEPAEQRVLRGGNWGALAEMARAAGRSRRPPAAASDQLGFRCAAPRNA